MMKHFILFIVLLCSVFSYSQENGEKTKVEILNSDEASMDPAITEAARLIGNVRLKYKETLMNCDSAYRFSNGDFQAFSRIVINQGDTLRLFGDLLDIDVSEQKAKLRENIRMKDKDMTLTTDVLDYDFETEIASYFEGGKIVSTENNNVLTSNQGFYDSQAEFFHFRDDVILKNPEYTVESDTLKYSGGSETAYFFGPTTIRSKQNEIYCENGWYDTKNDICQFNENAIIQSKSTRMQGDSIFYSGKEGIGEVFGNVFINDTTSNYSIAGEYGWHDENLNESLVTDRAQMLQYFDKDTLYLHADTLMSVPDSLGKNKIQAFHHVKFYKSDMQGKSDSLTYSETDSLLVLFGEPILWSKENQISGELIHISMSDGTIDELNIFRDSFIISNVDEGSYNQIKGKNLTGYFSDNELRTIFVQGNGQTIYYPEEEDPDNPEVKKVTGINRVDCSNIRIQILDSDIEKITLLDKPSGALNPLSLASEADKFLEGFFWESLNRPLKAEDIFNWNSEK